MKKRDDYGPADFYAEGQMLAGAVFFFLILLAVIVYFISKLFA